MNSTYPHFQIFAAKLSDSSSKFEKPLKSKLVLLLSDIPFASHEEMVSKMVGALKLDLKQDIHTIQLTPQQRISLASYCRNTDISHILVFGVSPEQLALHINWPQYRVMELSGLKILFAHSLSDVAENREIKLQLWRALQLMFPQ